jgi:hypothetical protein
MSAMRWKQEQLMTSTNRQAGMRSDVGQNAQIWRQHAQGWAGGQDARVKCIEMSADRRDRAQKWER